MKNDTVADRKGEIPFDPVAATVHLAPVDKPDDEQDGVAKEPPLDANLMANARRKEGGNGSRGAALQIRGTQLLKPLRELRAEVIDLQAVLTKISKGETTPDAQGAYITKSVADIEEIISLLYSVDADTHADTLRHIINLWEQMKGNDLLQSPGDNTLTAQEQAHGLTLLTEAIDRMVYHIGWITVPSRIREWLTKCQPGYYVPFHDVVADELPREEDRNRILDLLSLTPNSLYIEGDDLTAYVDGQTGLIYRVDHDGAMRRRSLWKLAAWFVGVTIAFVAFAAVRTPLVPFQWPVLGTMLLIWGGVLVGVLAHGIVGRAKSVQSNSNRPPIIATGGFSLLANAKFGELLYKLWMALFGAAGYFFTVEPERLTVYTAFLIGYSLDSFVELFSANLEKQSSAQVTVMKQKLGQTTT